MSLIIYDCDGTLIDSETIAGAECARAITSLGLSYTVEAFNLKFTGIPARITWQMLEQELGRPLPEGFSEAVNVEIHRRFHEELELIAGVREAVEQLGQPRCVASSTGLPSLRRNLEKVGLLDVFDPGIFSASQVKRGKPAPDVFLYAASQMGFDPVECIVIEDSVNGVLAARRAGMRVVGFTGGGHATEALGPKLLAAGAGAVIAHMEHLPGLVGHWRA
jgi:HAD superfamily hydrolase (TIGR01509 family)